MSLFTNRPLLAIALELSLVIGTSLAAPIWAVSPSYASVTEPAAVSDTSGPAGILLNSPWITDSSGTMWAYGTTSGSTGTLVSRSQSTGTFTTTSFTAGDEGSIASAYFAATNVAVFSSRRVGFANRMSAFNLTNGTRISTRTLAPDETNIRAITFNSNGLYYLVGTNTNPARILKYDVASSGLQSSVTLGSGLKEISAFIPNGNDAYAAVNTSPVKLIPFSKSTLTVGNAVTLPAEIPVVLDPLVIGNIAYFGTDASPGRVTAFDLATKTVIGVTAFGTDETGARNLVADSSTGTLYATTESSSGSRVVSFDLATLTRLGHSDLGPGDPPTAMTRAGNRLIIAFSGLRGFQTLSTSPPPQAPVAVMVTERDSSLVVQWEAPSSAEPVLDYTVVASHNGEASSCVTSDTTCTVTGLINGIDYAVTVTARSVAGLSDSSAARGTPFSRPSPPNAPTVIRGDRLVSVSWDAPASGGRDIIEYSALASPSGSFCVTTARSCDILGLPNGHGQTITVTARNIAGWSDPSDPSDEVVPATTPDAPDISNLRVNDDGVSLTWVSPLNDGGEAITSYRVTVWREADVVETFDTAMTTATLTGLTNNTEFRVSISALNGVGVGVATVLVFVTPVTPEPPVVDPPVVDPPVPPDPEPPVVEPPVVEPPVVDPPDTALVPASPIALTVLAASRTHVTVGWVLLDPGSSPVTDYRVERSRFRNHGFAPIRDGVTATTWLNIRKPRRGALFVRVIAVNAVGESIPSRSRRVV